jgi:hypothetical protein
MRLAVNNQMAKTLKLGKIKFGLRLEYNVLFQVVHIFHRSLRVCDLLVVWRYICCGHTLVSVNIMVCVVLLPAANCRRIRVELEGSLVNFDVVNKSTSPFISVQSKLFK